MRVVLIPLALLLAMFAWFAWSWESPRPDGPAAAPAPVAAVPVVPVQAEAPVAREPERVVPEWRPDGRIWLRVRDGGADGELLRSGNFAWADVDARQAPGREVVADEDGWWRVESSPGPVLLLSARGFDTAALVDATPDQQREVVLTRAVRVPLDVVDCDTGAVAPQVVVEVSRQSWDAVADAPIVLPGADPATAIYRATASEDGGAELFVPAVGDAAEWQLAVAHRHYMLAHRQPETLPLRPFERARVEVQMPLVGAIRYVGGELLSGTSGTSLTASPSTWTVRERERLEALHRQLKGEDAGVVAIAFLPERVGADVSKLYASANVMLRRGGTREDRIRLQRLCDYDGPQEIECPDGPEVLVGKVTLRPPPPGRFPVDVTGLRIYVSAGGRGKMVITRFGETIELPNGNYSIGYGPGGDCLKRQRIDVVGSGSQEFELAWRDGMRLYQVAISGAPEIRHAQLRVAHEGKHYICEGARDGDGVASFFSSYPIESGTVYVRYHQQRDVTFTLDAAGIGHAACTTEPR